LFGFMYNRSWLSDEHAHPETMFVFIVLLKATGKPKLAGTGPRFNKALPFKRFNRRSYELCFMSHPVPPGF